MPKKESITWWAQLVRGLRPDEPWYVEPETVVRSRVPAVHAWANFTFKTFAEFARALNEITNRVEAYHAGEDNITIEVVHGANGWELTLDLLIRESARTRDLTSMLEEAPSDGDGAAWQRTPSGRVLEVDGEPVGEVSEP